MQKLKEQIKKELTEIEEKGVNASNLELISKLADIYKDLGEIEKWNKEVKKCRNMADIVKVAVDTAPIAKEVIMLVVAVAEEVTVKVVITKVMAVAIAA